MILTLEEAELLVRTLGDLAEDDEKEVYLANGKHPAWRRSSFISDADCLRLFLIKQKLQEERKKMPDNELKLFQHGPILKPNK